MPDIKKTSLSDAMKILNISYRDLASESNLSYNAIYHLTQKKYSSQAISKLKVEAALNLIKSYEISKCLNQIDALKERVEMLKNLEIDI